ncbi:MAG TPA: hypothetical protein VHY31_05410 [Streptosporangiaceae bacterium]|jgi:ABC-type nickel/cobalt efflux system permease component RcnA|nr:hypothetical protein [Streptosporangiaceae bacterium]
MRLVKILAIAVAVLIVFWVASALLHLLYLIGIGIVLAAAIFAAYKGWEQYKQAQRRHAQRRQERTRERAERRPGHDIEPAGDHSIEQAHPQPQSLSTQFDVDEELARLKRELG